MKKKICMIVQDPNVKGGMAAVVSGYYGSKLEQDYDITYVESYRDGSRMQKLGKALHGYGRFIKILIVNKPDLVHIHSAFKVSFYRKVPFVLLSGMFHVPVINHIHGSMVGDFYTKQSPKRQRFIRNMYDRCDRVITLSEMWKERLTGMIREEKIAVLNNYSSIHEENMEVLKVRTSNHTILFLGLIRELKGCFDIPAVAAIVKEQIPDVRFVIGGAGDAADEQKMRDLIEQYDVADCFEFPGWIRDQKKDEILKEADIFFLPSYSEGMPMAILDAMGYGLPIVSTNVGGIPTIVHEGENGYLCEPGDAEAMAQQIIDLLTDRERYQELSAKSFAIAKKDYSLEAHIEKLEEIYEEVLSN